MNPQIIVILIFVILISLTVHEFAHGFIAYKFGDDTAKNAGRLSWNPFSHLDTMGTIVFLISLSAFNMPFGWAKPVPVNLMRLSRPKRDMVFVALAGPLSNVVFALFLGFLYRFIASSFSLFPQSLDFFFYIAVQANLGLAIFNLVPVFPLDGFSVLTGILPSNTARRYAEITKFAPHVLLGIIIFERLIRYPILSKILSPVFVPWFSFWNAVIGI
jgi:Zn-dependent protease